MFHARKLKGDPTYFRPLACKVQFVFPNQQLGEMGQFRIANSNVLHSDYFLVRLMFVVSKSDGSLKCRAGFYFAHSSCQSFLQKNERWIGGPKAEWSF